MALDQKKFYRIVENANYKRYWAVQIYFIFHSLACWILAGLMLAALTGIIKKE